MKSYLFFLFGILLASCNQKMHVAHVDPIMYSIDQATDSTPVHEEIIDIIEPYRQQLEVEMNQVIGVVHMGMQKRKPESSLTHWLGDVISRQAKAATNLDIDFSLMNYGGIRLPDIPKGPITTGKVYELMPFDNYIVILEVSGAEVWEIFQKIAASGGGWPVCDQVSMSIREKQILDLRIGGKKIVQEETYLMATSNFLADGGDGLKMLTDNTRFEIDVLIRDAIIKDIREMTSKQTEITASHQGRMFNQ